MISDSPQKVLKNQKNYRSPNKLGMTAVFRDIICINCQSKRIKNLSLVKRPNFNIPYFYIEIIKNRKQISFIIILYLKEVCKKSAIFFCFYKSLKVSQGKLPPKKLSSENNQEGEIHTT